MLHFHRLLHKSLSQAGRWQLLARNPAAAVEPPKPQRAQMRALDEGEMAQLLVLVQNKRLWMPTLLAVTGGLRRGEILALRWQDLDMNSCHFAVIGGYESRAAD
jgi:integrase